MAKMFYYVDSCRDTFVNISPFDLSGQIDVHDETDDDRGRKDDKVWNICHDDDVSGHLTEAFVGDKSVGQIVNNGVWQPQQSEQDDHRCRYGDQW